MKIFASWSGGYSKSVAELLREWIPNVIQEAVVYVSSQDIAKGESWPDSVRGNLSEIDLGVVVVTKTNFEAPWILFEAGALSKSVKSRMIPLLCDVEHVDLAKSPLRLFQSSMVTETDVFAMMQSLNSFAASPLTEERLTVAFEKWWPDFAEAFGKLKPDAAKVGKASKSTEDSVVVDALEALLADVQGIKAQLRGSDEQRMVEYYQHIIDRYREELPDHFLRRAREAPLRVRRAGYPARATGAINNRYVDPRPRPEAPTEISEEKSE